MKLQMKREGFGETQPPRQRDLPAEKRSVIGIGTVRRAVMARYWHGVGTGRGQKNHVSEFGHKKLEKCFRINCADHVGRVAQTGSATCLGAQGSAVQIARPRPQIDPPRGLAETHPSEFLNRRPIR